MNLDAVSILLILGMGQCLFLMFFLVFNKKGTQIANGLLFVLLFALLWYQLEFFLLRHKLDAKTPFIYSTRYGSWLILGPLIFLYNRASMNRDFRLSVRQWMHFLPFITLTVILPVLLDGLITHRSMDYGMLTVFDTYNQEKITTRHYIYGYIFLFQFLHASLYIFAAYKETRTFEEQLKTQKSTLGEARIQMLKYLYISSLTIVGLCTLFIAYIFYTTYWRRNMDYLYVLPMVILVFGLAYRYMKHPHVLERLPEDKPHPKYVKSGLTSSAKQAYREKLEQKLRQEKFYRNNDLRLADLAASLEMSVHHLSQLINEEFNQNFFDFINAYRVKEAQQEIAEHSDQTLLEIAYAVGFNNKNSFNTAFKKHVGMTPSAFRKSLDKG
ncbi:MAG: helix-turn-helix domain-containing protein [Bacteroidota bacterium]